MNACWRKFTPTKRNKGNYVEEETKIIKLQQEERNKEIIFDVAIQMWGRIVDGEKAMPVMIVAVGSRMGGYREGNGSSHSFWQMGKEGGGYDTVSPSMTTSINKYILFFLILHGHGHGYRLLYWLTYTCCVPLSGPLIFNNEKNI